MPWITTCDGENASYRGRVDRCPECYGDIKWVGPRKGICYDEWLEEQAISKERWVEKQRRADNPKPTPQQAKSVAAVLADFPSFYPHVEDFLVADADDMWRHRHPQAIQTLSVADWLDFADTGLMTVDALAAATPARLEAWSAAPPCHGVYLMLLEREDASVEPVYTGLGAGDEGLRGRMRSHYDFVSLDYVTLPAERVRFVARAVPYNSAQARKLEKWLITCTKGAWNYGGRDHGFGLHGDEAFYDTAWERRYTDYSRMAA